MNYSINKLSPLIMLGAKQSVVVVVVEEGGRRGEGGVMEGEGERGRRGFIVSVTLNDIAATLGVMKTTSKVI